jgi:hypothetical protein
MARKPDLRHVWPPSLKMRRDRERHPRYWLRQFLIGAGIIAAIIAGRYLLWLLGVA